MNLQRVRDRLLRLAGYSATERGSFYISKQNKLIHEEFQHIMGTLNEIAQRKVDGYGPFRYDELTDNWRWEAQSLYQDIERKFGRLKTMMRPNPVNLPDSDQLLDVLADLAVYSARGIQIIERMKDKLHPEQEVRMITERQAVMERMPARQPDTTRYGEDH